MKSGFYRVRAYTSKMLKQIARTVIRSENGACLSNGTASRRRYRRSLLAIALRRTRLSLSTDRATHPAMRTATHATAHSETAQPASQTRAALLAAADRVLYDRAGKRRRGRAGFRFRRTRRSGEHSANFDGHRRNRGVGHRPCYPGQSSSPRNAFPSGTSPGSPVCRQAPCRWS